MADPRQDLADELARALLPVLPDRAGNACFIDPPAQPNVGDPVIFLGELAFLRRHIRSKLTSPNQPMNTDSLIGKHALVTERIAPHAPGMVRVGDELWRAAVPSGDSQAIEPGSTVTVVSIDGVTLSVKAG